jgi:hypothetical protein
VAVLVVQARRDKETPAVPVMMDLLAAAAVLAAVAGTVLSARVARGFHLLLRALLSVMLAAVADIITMVRVPQRLLGPAAEAAVHREGQVERLTQAAAGVALRRAVPVS